MSNNHETWTDRFTDYLGGDLDEAGRVEVDMHLASCGPCRRVLEELREVVARAAGLDDVRPPRDLWPGIAAAIEGPIRAQSERGGARVIALPTSRDGVAPREPARITFTAPQLAAAALVLIALSVATTWWAGPGLGVRVVETPALSTSPATMMVAEVPSPPEGLAVELAALGEVLEVARATLDPNTLRVLERNLDVIEQAIGDSRRALALDPDNAFLTHHLERSYERKLAYLKDAARVIEWAG